LFVESGDTMHTRSTTGGRLAAASVAIVILLAAGGCVDRTASSDATTYDYAWWVPVVTLVSALAAFPIGLVLRNRRGRIGGGLLVLSPVLAFLVFPMLLLDKVKVDAQHFEDRYGLWFMPSSHNVRFDDLREIRLVTYQQRTRRGGRTTRQKLVCIHKSGAPQDTVQLGTLVKEAAPEILRRAGEHGVTVTEETQ
jgi:hypothetical protein